MEESEAEDDFPWDLGVFDAHCHPTDTMSSIPDISQMNTRVLTIMATRAQDQSLVANIAEKQDFDSEMKDNEPARERKGIVPSFGWHPWFAHQMYDNTGQDKENPSTMDAQQKIKHYQSVLNPPPDDDTFIAALPEPRSLSSFLAETEERLRQYPKALVGEVGLDKAFRIPTAWLPGEIEGRDDSLTPGGREGRKLSPYRVSMEHQRIILIAQLRLAGRLRRAVSVHGVQAHGILFDTLAETWKGHEKKVVSQRQRKRQGSVTNAHTHEGEHTSEQDNEAEYPDRVCLHSYSGPPDTLKQYLNPKVPTKFYFSFSMAINFSTSSTKTDEVIKSLPSDRILVESDMHIAGPQMDSNLKSIIEKVCALRDWPLSNGVRQLGNNWKSFVLGSEPH